MDIEEKLRVQLDFVNSIKKSIGVYYERGGSVESMIKVLKHIIKDYK